MVERVYDVFLSYAHDDWRFAQELAASFRDKGADVFFDVWESPPDEMSKNDFLSKLLTALSQSKSAVLCCGDPVAQTSWVEVERSLVTIRQREDGEFQVARLPVPAYSLLSRDSRALDEISEGLLSRLGIEGQLKQGDTTAVSKLLERPCETQSMWGGAGDVTSTRL